MSAAEIRGGVASGEQAKNACTHPFRTLSPGGVDAEARFGEERAETGLMAVLAVGFSRR
jgi:hypothetical protein